MNLRGQCANLRFGGVCPPVYYGYLWVKFSG
jgi:hypothetical protein